MTGRSVLDAPVAVGESLQSAAKDRRGESSASGPSDTSAKRRGLMDCLRGAMHGPEPDASMHPVQRHLVPASALIARRQSGKRCSRASSSGNHLVLQFLVFLQVVFAGVGLEADVALVPLAIRVVARHVAPK